VNAPSPRNDAVAKDIAPRNLSPLRLTFRILRWATYLGAIITLLMAFHTVPPPVIVTSPQRRRRSSRNLWLLSKPWRAANPRRFASIRLN